MDQRRGLERLAGRLARQPRRGEPAQLVVDQRQQLAGGPRLAPAEGVEDRVTSARSGSTDILASSCGRTGPRCPGRASRRPRPGGPPRPRRHPICHPAEGGARCGRLRGCPRWPGGPRRRAHEDPPRRGGGAGIQDTPGGTAGDRGDLDVAAAVGSGDDPDGGVIQGPAATPGGRWPTPAISPAWSVALTLRCRRPVQPASSRRQRGHSRPPPFTSAWDAVGCGNVMIARNAGGPGGHGGGG